MNTKLIKTFLILLCVYSNTYGAVDPAPPHVVIRLDSTTNKLIDTITFASDTSNGYKYIKPYRYEESQNNFEYTFFFRGNPFNLKLILNDSSEVLFNELKHIHRASYYSFHLDDSNQINIDDISNAVNKERRLSFTKIMIIIFSIIKFLPFLIIVIPNKLSLFFSRFSALQLIYLILLGLAYYQFGATGFLIGFLAFGLTIAFDAKTIRAVSSNELNKKIKLYVTLSLTLLFALLLPLLFLFIIIT